MLFRSHNVGMLLLCPEVDHIYSFALCGGEAADVVGEDAEAGARAPPAKLGVWIILGWWGHHEALGQQVVEGEC